MANKSATKADIKLARYKEFCQDIGLIFLNCWSDQPDIKADIGMDDRGETIDLMQPMRIGEGSPHLSAVRDLAMDLALKVAAFRSSLPHSIRTALAQLVRAMFETCGTAVPPLGEGPMRVY